MIKTGSYTFEMVNINDVKAPSWRHLDFHILEEWHKKLIDLPDYDVYPIEVRDSGDHYSIENGRHRYLASFLAERTHVPCLIRIEGKK